MDEYIYDSDIVESDAQVIVQQCNCVSKTAKGLSKIISERFPHADFYSTRKKKSTPGTIEMRGGKGVGRFVCALYAQVSPGGPSDKKGDSEKEREKYFARCLTALGKVKNIREVAFPYNIGCGLAKGNWEKYSDMIEEFATNNEQIRVLVISKEPQPEEHDFGGDPAFIKWVCNFIERNPEILKDYPDFLGMIQKEYYDYLHNVSEDDADPVIVAEPDIGETIEDEGISWCTTTLEEYTKAHTPEGWEGFFVEQLDPDCGSISISDGGLSKYLFGETQKGEIYPPINLIYKSFHLSKPQDIKVVIVGQDPYINPGEAMGISFSVPVGVDIPPSLRNIYKELSEDGFTVSNPSSGDLTKWCKQGVFLINSALTVRAHESGSHSKKWNENFSPQLMRWINDPRATGPMVIILWGNHAQNFSKFFDDRHRKIMSAHPSPLSAHRGFFGSKPFSKANKHLVALGHDPIDWSL